MISNSAMFEYKTPPREQQTSSVKETSSNASNDNLLKFTLLQRLEAMDDRLEIKQEPDIGPDLVSWSNVNKIVGHKLSNEKSLYLQTTNRRTLVDDGENHMGS